MWLKQQERSNDEQIKLAFDLEHKVEKGDINEELIDNAIDNIDALFSNGLLTGQSAIDVLDDFFGRGVVS